MSASVATAGIASVIGGAFLLWGVGAALVVFGVLAIAGAVLLYDPAERRGGQ